MALRAFALATMVAGGVMGGVRSGHASPATSASAAPSAAEEFDDPKLSREGLVPVAPVRAPAPSAPPSEPSAKGAEKPAADKAAAKPAEKPAAAKPIAAKPVAAKKAVAAEKAVTDKAAVEKPPAEKPVAEKLAVDKTAEKAVAEEPPVEKAVEKTAPEKIGADGAAEKPGAEKPGDDKSASSKGSRAGTPASPATAAAPPALDLPPPHASASPAASPSPAGGTADVKAVAAPRSSASEAPARGPWPYVPRLKLAYRRFPFSRIAAVTADGVTTSPVSESFESLSIDTYPMSSYLRVGLSTQFGWESGQFHRTGDYFLAESASVGFQVPGRYTPFVEALAGAGYMRRRQPDSILPTAYWQVGVDVGVELYFAKRAYGSVAIGYLHPANLFFAQRNLQSVNLDTWSLKIGIGI